MCTVLLPPGVNPIAVNKYIISYITSHRIVSYRIISYIISYHITSYIISYHITSYIISYHISYQILPSEEGRCALRGDCLFVCFSRSSDCVVVVVTRLPAGQSNYFPIFSEGDVFPATNPANRHWDPRNIFFSGYRGVLLPPKDKAAGVWSWPHLYLVPRLRESGARPPFYSRPPCHALEQHSHRSISRQETALTVTGPQSPLLFCLCTLQVQSDSRQGAAIA